MPEPQRKHIAFLVNSVLTYGGEQRVLSILANALTDFCTVTIITEDDILALPADSPYPLKPAIHLRHFKPFKADFLTKCLRGIFKLPIMLRLRRFPLTWKWTHYNKKLIAGLREILQQDNYDTIVVLSDRLSVLAGFAKKSGLTAKVIAWEHNSFEAYFRTPGICLWQQDILFRTVAPYFERCVVLNEDYAEKYKKHFGITCDVIYNPRSFVSEQKAVLTNTIFFTCCRLKSSTKGLDLLLDAFEIFCQHNTDWELLIAGDGPDREKLEDLAEARHIKNRIQFLGYRNDIKELLLQSSVFLLPSRWEGFPMTLTEAYECGVPVIAFDIPAIIPFQTNGGIAVAKSFDTNEFAHAMLSLANDFNYRKKLSKAAIQFAQKLSTEHFVQQWQNILHLI